MSWNEEREGNAIRITATDPAASFVLRLHGEEIDAVRGADWTEIEPGDYLLTMTGGQAEILLKDRYTVGNLGGRK